MKRAFVSMVAVLFVAGLVSFAHAADKAPGKAAGKEVTYTGTLECAKCELKETKECQNVLVVKDNGKETKYYLEGKVSKDKHGDVCKAPKDNVSVTGTVSEKGGKKVLTATKIEG